MTEIGILGGGSWATAMASLIGEKEEIVMYVRKEEDSKYINENHQNRKYLKGHKLSENIHASSDLKEVASNKKILINAIPTQATRSVLKSVKEYIDKDTIILNISKGIEANTLMTISQISKELLPNNTYAILSGPSHAEEVIDKKETSVVIASDHEKTRLDLQKRFNRKYFRIYTNEDVIGVELGGSLKNVLAIGMGVAETINLGDNGVAGLITRGMYEMSKFAILRGGKYTTLYGLAGLGDLIVTAMSKYSRNRKAGELLAKGLTLDQIQKEVGMAIEGVMTCQAIIDIAKKENIDMPISMEIYNMLFKNQEPRKAIENLMNRKVKDEFRLNLDSKDIK